MLLETEEGAGGEKHRCERGTAIGCLLLCAPTGDWTHNLGRGPGWESNLRPSVYGPCSNQLSHTSQGPTSTVFKCAAQWFKCFSNAVLPPAPPISVPRFCLVKRKLGTHRTAVPPHSPSPGPWQPAFYCPSLRF